MNKIEYLDAIVYVIIMFKKKRMNPQHKFKFRY